MRGSLRERNASEVGAVLKVAPALIGATSPLLDVVLDTPSGDTTLIVMVDPIVAEELRSAEPAAGRADRLRQIIQAAGVRIDPLHAEVDAPTGPGDEDLTSFFVVTAAAGADVDRLAHQLQSLPEVQAAYVKPHDEAP